MHQTRNQQPLRWCLLQQFYMHALPDLRDLIMGRIQQAHRLPLDQAALVAALAPAPNIDAELQVNRAAIRHLAALKRSEKERAEAESELLEEMRNVRFLNSRTIDDVFAASAQIFSSFDPAFLPRGEQGMTASDRLRHLFIAFFEKHKPGTAGRKAISMLENPITDTTPGLLLGWVSEWSKIFLVDCTQAVAGGEFARHEEEMRRLSSHRGPAALLREKSASPISHSAFLGRGERPATPVLTNKESVFGLFLEEMSQLYRALPLDLDLSFPKSMKKLAGRSDFWGEDSLQRAAEILIEAKNRHTRDQIAQFATDCHLYLQRNAKTAREPEKSVEGRERGNAQIRQKAQQKSLRKKRSPFEKFFERVKSESKEEGLGVGVGVGVGVGEKRNSLLLCPKANEISFESSRQIMRKLHKDKLRRDLELPEIAPGRVLSTCAPTSKQKNKNPFIESNHSVASNYERYERALLKNPIPTKSYDFKQPPCPDRQREYQRKSKECRVEINENPQMRQEGQQLRRNRKMMLQLLREKNKHAFLDK